MFKNEYVKGVCQILHDQNTLVVERATRILFVLMIGNSQRNVEPLLTPPSPSATSKGGRKSPTASFSVAKIPFPYETSPDSLVTMIMSLTSSVQWCYSHIMQADAINGEFWHLRHLYVLQMHFHSHIILKRISFVYTIDCSVHFSKIS